MVGFCASAAPGEASVTGGGTDCVVVGGACRLASFDSTYSILAWLVGVSLAGGRSRVRVGAREDSHVLVYELAY